MEKAPNWASEEVSSTYSDVSYTQAVGGIREILSLFSSTSGLLLCEEEITLSPQPTSQGCHGDQLDSVSKSFLESIKFPANVNCIYSLKHQMCQCRVDPLNMTEKVLLLANVREISLYD